MHLRYFLFQVEISFFFNDLHRKISRLIPYSDKKSKKKD